MVNQEVLALFQFWQAEIIKELFVGILWYLREKSEKWDVTKGKKKKKKKKKERKKKMSLWGIWVAPLFKCPTLA